MTAKNVQQPPRVLGPDDGERSGWATNSNRFLLDGRDTGKRLSVVEHTVPPHCLAGPVHIHTREDEYSYVLEGRVAALFGNEEVVAEAGDLVYKPRGEWHTFWNPSDEPLRILELITPSGLEDLFRKLGAGDLDPSTLPALAAEYGCEVDFDRTGALVERHRLTF